MLTSVCLRLLIGGDLAFKCNCECLLTVCSPMLIGDESDFFYWTEEEALGDGVYLIILSKYCNGYLDFLTKT